MLLATPQQIISNKNSVGKKAYHLAQMVQAGFTVPPFVVIPHTVLSGKDFIDFSTEIKKQLGEGTFAVRSSSVAEDGTSHSFAGLFETILNVPTKQLNEKIQQVYASFSSARVQTYLKTQGIKGTPTVAVIVQKMIPAQTSGVAFGAHPVTGKQGIVLINSVYGVGEGIVSGALNADSFTVENGTISPQITQKTEGFFATESGRIEKQIIPTEKQNIPSLSDTQLLAVATQVEKLNQYYTTPQDVEFCFENNILYILQSRPITTLKTEPVTDYIVWDNSNIIESYPGVTTPLTFSFIVKVYEAVYTQFVIFMGVPKKEAFARTDVFANMLGLINGRVYYNLLGWYKALAMLPGYRLNAGFMEKMMGVKEKFTLQLPPQNKLKAWGRIAIMVPKMIYKLATLEKQKNQFLINLEKNLKIYEANDYQTIPAEKIAEDFDTLEKILVNEWKTPLTNDFFAMIYFGLLQKVSTPVGTNTHNDLLCGSNDIISSEPARRIMEMVELISSDEKLNNTIKQNSPEKIIAQLNNYPKFEQLFNSYLQKFGDRCLEELKLETHTFGQEPQKLMAIIKAHASAGISKQVFNPQKIRQEAEAQFAAHYKNKPIKRALATHVLKGARRLVSNRENLRFERTRVFGLVRKMFRGIGTHFYKQGIINHPDDIFYLSKTEIFDFIKGTAVSTQLKPLISVRKDEYAHFATLPRPASRIKTTGIVYTNNFDDTSTATPHQGDLTGMGCCRGIVRAKVRVITDPSKETSLAGDILVTENTDPGWVTLFPSASGILVERGSLLSHSAILSREMGLPCIVSISSLMATLKTGDIVEMDGEKGTIKIISE